jgi:hypothetical protein
MEAQVTLEIIEPNRISNGNQIYFDGKNNLKLMDVVIERLQLTKSDEYVLLAKLGEDIYIAKKTPGSNVFGWHARNKNKTKPIYYITGVDLKTKLGFVRGLYRLDTSFEQQGFLWFKIVRV